MMTNEERQRVSDRMMFYSKVDGEKAIAKYSRYVGFHGRTMREWVINCVEVFADIEPGSTKTPLVY